VLRIVVIIPSFYPAVVYGGTIVSSYNTAKAIAALGHEVSVLTTNTNMYSRLDVPCNQWQYMDGFRVKYYNETVIDKLSLPLLFSMWREIRKADVVHIQAIFNTPTPVALFYSWLFNKSVVLSPRGVMGEWILNQGNKGKRLWLKWLIRPFVKNITWHATSGMEMQEILQHFPQAKVKVIANGVDVEHFLGNKWLSKKDYLFKYTHQDFPEKTKVITSMGRIHAKKGFNYLIEAVTALDESIVLLIAGQDEGEQSVLEEMVSQKEVAHRVFFVGEIPSVLKKEFLIHSDVFALTSHNENFGNVYAEALACGLPIVASQFTPWQEVERYTCGKWVPLDIPVIITALTECLQMDARVSHQARQFINRYSWQTIGKSFVSLFEELKK
jgi:glycosyltransferase involved in cell wall biosynthesis